MAKRPAKRSSILKDAAAEGITVPGTKEAAENAASTFTVDLLVGMIADRIRAGEDPEEAAKAVLDLAKEFSKADEVIVDDEENVTVEEEQKEDPNGD